MPLSRRRPLTWHKRVPRWSRHGWVRTARYACLRLQRLRTLPKGLAIGAAVGVFVAMLPIPGLQLLTAAGLAWLLRGHQGSAALATFAANPVTYPLIWISSYVIGATILGTPIDNATHDLDAASGQMAQLWKHPGLTPQALSDALQAVRPVMTTLIVGSLPLAVGSAVVAFLGMRHVLTVAVKGRRRAATGRQPADAASAATLAWRPLRTTVSLAIGALWRPCRQALMEKLRRWTVLPRVDEPCPPYLLPFWGAEMDG